jgi:hypothetical protein
MKVRAKRLLLIASLLLASPLLTGCTQEDIDWLISQGRAWARAQGLLDESGNLDYVGIGIWYAFPTSDSEARAALEAGAIVADMEAAAATARDGLAQGDLSLIEKAIDSRPSDWSFVEQKAALLLAQGDEAAAQQAFAAAEQLVQTQIDLGGNCLNLARNLLTHRQMALEMVLDQGPNQAVQERLDATLLELNLLQEGQPSLLCP